MDGHGGLARSQGQFFRSVARAGVSCRTGHELMGANLGNLSRMRCSVERESAERCTADPGSPQTVTVPGLQRTTTQSSVRRLRKLICVAALRPGHTTHEG